MFKELLQRVVAGEDLNRQQAQEAMRAIMSGEVGETALAAFLTALRMKQETPEEVAGFAAAMRQLAQPLQVEGGTLDTCGTGGDGAGTFNISTTVAFVLAGAGVKVAKHGNRGVSSKSGSADVLQALGVEVELAPAAVAKCIEETGIGFLFAPQFHLAMRHAAKTRRELGFRTVFNLLGPLTNPAGAEYQLLGVYQRSLTRVVGEALAALGTKRAMVVHSLDGLDELSTAAPNQVTEVVGGKVTSYLLDAADLGFAPAKIEDYSGGTPLENAAITEAILRGEKGPKQDVVLLNAAAALLVAGKAESLQEGVVLGRRSIESGAALAKLEELRRVSQKVRGLSA